MCYELLLLLPLWNCFYYHNFLVVLSKCKKWHVYIYIWCVFCTYDVLMWNIYNLHFN
jgi:hypothetical protein